MAIGPKNSKPIELVLPSTPNSQERAIRSTTTAMGDAQLHLPPIAATTSSPTTTSSQNTVILREVPNDVTEDDLRQLFDFEGCPPIQQVQKDVANYWFVVLNPSCHDDMVTVMFTLRDLSYNNSGEPVKARLKSGVIPSLPPPSVQLLPSPMLYAGDRNVSYRTNNNKEFQPSNKHYNTNKTGNNNNKSSMNNTNNNQYPKDNGGTKKVRSNNKNNRGKNNKADTASQQKSTVVQQPPPPPLVDSQFFPSLEKPRIIATPPPPTKTTTDEDEDTKPSDGASTATTSTSSSLVGGETKPKMPIMGGGCYAAALLKAPSTAATTKPTLFLKEGNHNKQQQQQHDANDSDKKKDTIPREVGETIADEVMVVPKMTWGGGRSFADVLKKNETAAALL